MTEDRKRDGLVMLLDVRTNMTLSSLKKYPGALLYRKKQRKEAAEDFRQRARVKPHPFSTCEKSVRWKPTESNPCKGADD